MSLIHTFPQDEEGGLTTALTSFSNSSAKPHEQFLHALRFPLVSHSGPIRVIKYINYLNILLIQQYYLYFKVMLENIRIKVLLSGLIKSFSSNSSSSFSNISSSSS